VSKLVDKKVLDRLGYDRRKEQVRMANNGEDLQYLSRHPGTFFIQKMKMRRNPEIDLH